MVLYDLATAHCQSQAVYTAAKLGISDLLADGPKTAEALAEATDTHAPSLRRLLRLLVSVGVFVEESDGRFRSNELGDALQNGHSGDIVQLLAGPSAWVPWGDLINTVRTGEQAFKRVMGKPAFEYFADRPEEAAVFDRAMASLTASIAAAVAKAYDFSSFTKVIDIGGGKGVLLGVLFEAFPHLSGAVFDLSRVQKRANDEIRQRKLEARYTFVEGDFFTSVPEGYDAYMIKHVIHDWDDVQAAAILRNVRAAIPARGKLLIVESIYPDRVVASPECSGAASHDCNMMVVVGGRQRSKAQFEALFEASGFRLARIVPTPARVSIIEADPA